MLKIDEFTICLHCGCDRDVVKNQMQSLKPLENEYNLYWNNRIDRFPYMYPTYSELINHSIDTSNTEWIILINDRCHPTIQEVKKMISLLENGFSCVLLYSVGFMGLSKELIRTIGWWDQRFIQGWEDRDWVWRIKLANLSLYESIESTYDQHWRSPLNHPAGRCIEDHLHAKYTFTDNILYKNLKEEDYDLIYKNIGEHKPEIRESWTDWNHSLLNVSYQKVPGALSGSYFVNGKRIIER